jgi:radical SAM protein with 4Fe4S-binding SPASM domain
LLKNGIRIIEVSVDAASAEVYEKIRIGLSFREVLYNIKELMKIRDSGGYNTKVMVSVIEQEENASQLDEIFRFWSSIVDGVLLRKLLSFKGIIPRNKKYIPYLPESAPCPFLWERVLVDSLGNVRGCVSDIYNTSCLGNLKTDTISELWQGKLLNEWRQLHLENRKSEVPVCKGCVDLEYRSWEYNYFSAVNKLDKG